MSAAPGTSSHDSSDSDRLNGWKEIASFLGKGVRTAQRWEKDYGLPFPRRCLHESVNGTGVVGHVWTDAMGSFFVRVEEGDPTMNGLRESSVTYVLDANLGLSRVEPDWGFFAAHDAWYKRGAIDHPASVATDGPTFFPVRVWRESGFVDLPPAPVDWSQFDARANR